MPFEIITIPFNAVTGGFSSGDLNKFCLNKRVLTREVAFFREGDTCYWSIFLEYESVLDKREKEETGLSEAEQLCFTRLKAWRNEKAQQEGIPPYVIAKNSQLVSIVKQEIVTLEGLKQIGGFGSKKLEKYGKEITALIKDFFGEKG